MSDAVKEHTPIHQWVHDGDRVLLVKCVKWGGTSYNDFQWPKSGTVTTPNWAPDRSCDSGGLFGWPWGLNLGGGKAPEYEGDWIVFAAPTASVIDVDEEKAKAGPSADVLFYGSWYDALNFTRAGREAWLEHRFAIARLNAIAAHDKAATNGASSGASSATGYRGASSATGARGASSATGTGGASSATGYRGAAALTGEWGTLEVGPNAAGVVTADEFFWIVRPGAIVLHRFEGGCTLLLTDGLDDGERVHVVKGIVEREKPVATGESKASAKKKPAKAKG